MDVAGWLRGLGLEQYTPAFRDNDIDGEVLRRLTADDLRELGVASIGHRRRLLDAAGDALRSRGSARDRRRLPPLRRGHGCPLRRVCRQVHGRWRARLLRLS